MSLSEAWKQERQQASANITYKVDGGERLAEEDLPSRFFNTKCLEAGAFHKCEAALEAFNKCEEVYFTKAKVDYIEKKMAG